MHPRRQHLLSKSQFRILRSLIRRDALTHMKAAGKPNLNAKSQKIRISQIKDVIRNHQSMVNVFSHLKDHHH